MTNLTQPPPNRSVNRGALRLNHVQWGDEANPTLVMLHGIRLHAFCWGNFARKYADRFRILALDARGHGDSDWVSPEDYHLHDFYEDVHAVMEARGVQRATLIGHSLGARIAMLYAHLHPERVERLVLVDMGPGLPGAAVKKDFSRVTETPRPRTFASHQEAIEYLSSLLTRAPREMIEESVIHGMRPVDGGQFTWKYDPALGGIPLPRKEKREWDLWEAVRTIECPTLLVYGADSMVVNDQVAAKSAAAMPDCRIERIENAGHALFTEQPEAFADSVGRFMKEKRGKSDEA